MASVEIAYGGVTAPRYIPSFTSGNAVPVARYSQMRASI